MMHTPGVPEDRSERGQERGAAGPRVWLPLLALLVLCSGLRLCKLELDPPQRVVPGYHGQAHFRDEAAKAHEARNKAKWGRWSLSEHDEYGFWRAQSPAWVWGEFLWFRGFGVGVLQARLFVVIQTIVALGLLMWLAMIRHGLPAALAVGALLGLNWAYLVYTRLALMEGALICWLVVVTAALSQLERRPREAGRWSMLAAVAMLIACTIKQTGLLLTPAFAVAMLILGLRAAGEVGGEVGGWGDADRSWPRRLWARLRRREAQVALIAVLTVAISLGLLILSPEYQERLAFNAAHFTAAREGPVFARAARTLIRGFFSARLQLMFLLLAPLMLWLATLELARVCIHCARGLWARRSGQPAPAPAPGSCLDGPADPIDLWMLAWAILALLANLASPHRAIRFQLVLLPPAAWLGGVMFARAWLHRWPRPAWTQGVRSGLAALGLLGLGLTALRVHDWFRYGEATAAWIGDELVEVIGEREAVVVGEFAAQAVFETDYQHFYLRPNQFNDTPEVIRALGPTHMVSFAEDDFVEELMADEVPELLVGRRKLGHVVFRGVALQVWELASEERRAQIEAWREAKREREAAKRKAEKRKAAQERREEARNRRIREREALQCLPQTLPEPEPITALPVLAPPRPSVFGARPILESP